MCIIAAIPTGVTISKETLNRCWVNNPHGGGFVCTDGAQVLIYKEMKSFENYWASFEAARNKYPDSSFICHFRISTHGKINEENCHPFFVTGKIAFCHNGIISNAPTSKDCSDTVMFNETILKNLPDGFLENIATLALVKQYIGYGSKLAFITHDNRTIFVNESAGVWDAGIWYSNTGYKESNYFDMGGERVSYYPSNGKQGNLSYPTGGYPPNYSDRKNAKKQAKNGLKNGAKQVKDLIDGISDKNVRVFGGQELVDSYNFNVIERYKKPCNFCDAPLSTYAEKDAGICIKCADKYATEYQL